MARYKTIIGYAAHARYTATLRIGGFTDASTYAREPYRYSPTATVYLDPMGRRVVIRETAHRRYEVYGVTTPVYATDDEALAAWQRARAS